MATEFTATMIGTRWHNFQVIACDVCQEDVRPGEPKNPEVWRHGSVMVCIRRLAERVDRLADDLYRREEG